MGKYAAHTFEKWFLYSLGMAVYLLNAYALSAPGGGFFGDVIAGLENNNNDDMDMDDDSNINYTKWGWIVLSVVVQIFYFVWNLHCILTPVSHSMRPLEEERPHIEGEFAMAGDCMFLKRE